MSAVGHRWRFYRTRTRAAVVEKELRAFDRPARAAVRAEMKLVKVVGLEEARHLRGDIYELRVTAGGQAYRLLFAQVGSKGRILLALHAFSKKTAATPPHEIRLAEQRLADWRANAAV